MVKLIILSAQLLWGPCYTETDNCEPIVLSTMEACKAEAVRIIEAYHPKEVWCCEIDVKCELIEDRT